MKDYWEVFSMKTTKLFPILLIFPLLTLSHALSLDDEPEECQTVDFYSI